MNKPRTIEEISAKFMFGEKLVPLRYRLKDALQEAAIYGAEKALEAALTVRRVNYTGSSLNETRQAIVDALRALKAKEIIK